MPGTEYGGTPLTPQQQPIPSKQPTMSWLKYGKTYPEINRNLGGLPDWLRKSVLSPGVSTLYSGLEGATGGFSSAVLRKLLPEWQQKIEEAQKEAPFARDVGYGAGMAVPVLATMGGGAPEVAAGQAAPFLSRLGSSLLRNLPISALLSLFPTAAEAIETGNIPKALKHGGIATAAGTVIPTAIEMAIPPIAAAASKARLRSWGQKPSDIKQALRGGAKVAGITGEGAQGMSIKTAQTLKNQIENLIGKYGPGIRGAEKFSETVSAGYKNLGALYDQAGITTADMLDDILKSQRIARLKVRFPQMSGKIDDTILNVAETIDQGTWREAYSGWLTKAANAGRLAYKARPVSPPSEFFEGEVAQAFKDHIGQAAEAIRAQTGGPGLSLQELNKLVGPQHAVKGAIERAATSVGAGAREGSQTAPRMALFQGLRGGRGLGTAVLGMGGGLGAGALLAPKPKKGNALDWLRYMGTIMGSSLAGGALLRGGVNLANRAALPILSTMEQVLPVAGRVGQALAARGGLTPALESTAPVGLQQGVPTPGTMGIPEVAASVANQADPAQVTSITAKEQQTAPEQVKQAQTETNTAFRNRIKQIIQSDWQQANAMYGGNIGIGLDDLTEMVRQATNNFDPKMSAGVLFRDPKEREQYLSTYNRALGLKSVDLQRAFTYEPGAKSWFKGIVGDEGETPLQQKSYTDLENMMVSMLTGLGKIDDPQIREIVAQDISNIRRLRVSPQMKRQALQDLLQTNYGLDLNMLRQYGLEI